VDVVKVEGQQGQKERGRRREGRGEGGGVAGGGGEVNRSARLYADSTVVRLTGGQRQAGMAGEVGTGS
jgi:hypothetical protein